MNTNRLGRKVGLFLCLGLLAAQGQDFESPFTFTPGVIRSNEVSLLTVAIHVPEHHHVYADRLSFEVNGTEIAAALPQTRRVTDKFKGGQRDVFERDFVATLPFPESNGTFAVNFQGCSESECYFPETRAWTINPDRSLVPVVENNEATAAIASEGTLTNGFRIAARSSGFLSSEKFLSFLDGSTTGKSNPDELTGTFARFGALATVGLILLGGLALNLTPCVLPMIPINLAILGAGARNQNRRRGFALGSAYGGGMAFAYGGLGLAVVLTGSKFGALNSSAWFNFGIAVVFVAMGLAMFDKLAIDFSRFQRPGSPKKSSRGAFLAAGVMGSFSALLAGACVAPVVISVLLLATTHYQKGDLLGLALPFILGLGMALPWPFAAAGLSFLPKPGAWMTRVKYAFGVIIFAFAAWYGWLGWNLAGFGAKPAAVVAKNNPDVELRAALEQSRRTGKPVVVDFWASWCKNCEAMEHSTFRDPKVRERLSRDFLMVKFQAEQLNDAAIKPVLDQFGVMGLPTCVVLRPESPEPSPVL